MFDFSVTLFTTSFVTLFVIIDPNGLTPVFVSLTNGETTAARRAFAPLFQLSNGAARVCPDLTLDSSIQNRRHAPHPGARGGALVLEGLSARARTQSVQSDQRATAHQAQGGGGARAVRAAAQHPSNTT